MYNVIYYWLSLYKYCGSPVSNNTNEVNRVNSDGNVNTNNANNERGVRPLDNVSVTMFKDVVIIYIDIT